MDIASSTPSTTLWEWRPTISDDDRRKLKLTVAGGGALLVVAIAVAVLVQSRYMIVLTALVAGIGALWFSEHRRLLSTRCTLDDNGMLTVADSKSTSAIDLAQADSIEIRHRTSNSEWRWFTPWSRWSIELAGPSGAVRHSVANVAGFFALSEQTMGALEADLVRLASERRTAVGSSPDGNDPQGLAAPVASMARVPPSVPATSAPAVRDRFEWQPRLSPNADRNRWLVRAAFGLPAAIIAIYAVIAYWDEGIVAVLLTAATVPGMLLLAGFALDVAIGRARSFRLVVDNGDVSVGRPPKMRSIPLAGSEVNIDQHTSTTTGANGQVVRASRWQLDVTNPAGGQLKAAFPSFGTATTSEDYLALERELRLRT